MTPQGALLICALFVLSLFVADRKRIGTLSSALWIPTLWVAILGSRPISTWFGLGVHIENPDDYLEGSSFDRIVFLALIGAGVLVLARQQIDWRAIIAANKWICLYFLYLGISVIWADYPFTAFKRWIKDLGNVVMVLVMLSQPEPRKAMCAVLARCCYLFLPASVLLIRYFPELGRSYNRWTGEVFNAGVTTFKNQLGMTVMVCATYLTWEFLTSRRNIGRTHSYVDRFNRCVLISMAVWLLHVADSATSLACTVLACGTLMTVWLPAIRDRLIRIHWYAVVVALLLLVASAVFDLPGIVLAAVDRDTTLTGRTDIWELALAEKVNPLFGAGFYSFWTGERIARFWDMYGVGMNQAHNGYLETYLIGGVVGVGLLIGMLLSAGVRVRKALLIDLEWGSLRLVFWITAVGHNFTEASFSKVAVLWFLLLAVMIEYPRQRIALSRATLAMSSERSEELRRGTAAWAHV